MATFNIATALDALDNLDIWTQKSVLGSWMFAVNSWFINAVTKALPDVEDESGIDGYTPFEYQRRCLMDEIQRTDGDFQSDIPVLLAVSQALEIKQAELMGPEASDNMTIQGTFEYIASRKPERSRFEAEYAINVAQNPRAPRISRKEYVDAQYAQECQNHERIVAKGADAVRLAETITVPEARTLDDAPESLVNAFQRKMEEKLLRRWKSLEMRLFNPRLNPKDRDAAIGDQMLIEAVMLEYGFDVPSAEQAAEANAAE